MVLERQAEAPLSRDEKQRRLQWRILVAVLLFALTVVVFALALIFVADVVLDFLWASMTGKSGSNGAL